MDGVAQSADAIRSDVAVHCTVHVDHPGQLATWCLQSSLVFPSGVGALGNNMSWRHRWLDHVDDGGRCVAARHLRSGRCSTPLMTTEQSVPCTASRTAAAADCNSSIDASASRSCTSAAPPFAAARATRSRSARRSAASYFGPTGLPGRSVRIGSVVNRAPQHAARTVDRPRTKDRRRQRRARSLPTRVASRPQTPQAFRSS